MTHTFTMHTLTALCGEGMRGGVEERERERARDSKSYIFLKKFKKTPSSFPGLLMDAKHYTPFIPKQRHILEEK